MGISVVKKSRGAVHGGPSKKGCWWGEDLTKKKEIGYRWFGVVYVFSKTSRGGAGFKKIM